MADGFTFNDWNTVAQLYGPQVAQILQQNNVPLNQVSQTITQAAPTFFQGGSPSGVGFVSGGSDPGQAFGGGGTNLGQALQSFFGGGGGGMQNQGTVNLSGTNNPNFQTSLLGAQALEAVGLNPTKTATINPAPSGTPSSSEFAQSGVSAVASPTQVDISGYPMPQTPGTIFAPNKALKPTGLGTPRQLAQQQIPPPYTPTPQPNAAQMPAGGRGTPFATVPAVNTAGIQPYQLPPAAPTTFSDPEIHPTGGPNPVRNGLTSAHIK